MTSHAPAVIDTEDPFAFDRFIEIPEVAQRLSLHPDTVRAWIRTGRWALEVPSVPVQHVGGKQVVSLRRLAEHINSEQAA